MVDFGCSRKKVSILWPAFLHHSFGEVRICTLWMGVQAKCLANVVHLHGINQTTCFQKPGISDSIFLRKGSRILFNFETNSGELTIHFLSTMYSMRATWSGPDCDAGVPILQHWTDFLLARQSFCQNGACLFSVPVQKNLCRLSQAGGRLKPVQAPGDAVVLSTIPKFPINKQEFHKLSCEIINSQLPISQ